MSGEQGISVEVEAVYPIKLYDGYTCRGTDARGRGVVFGDLLVAGDKVGPPERPAAFERDPTGEAAAYVDGIVVRRDDGLWVEEAPRG